MELEVKIRKKLRGFDLAVEFSVRDEVLALLGASGCGKSMTLKCIAGIETPDEGRILLNGRTLFDSEKGVNLAPQKRRVGYLFQDYALFPNMTVAENITFSARGTKEEKRKLLERELARFSLAGLENSYPKELSGGQKQRTAFARILASDAELLLLDEPFSALDSYLKWQLELELLHLFDSYGRAAVLVSHDRGEAYRLADRIAVLSSGALESLGTKHALFEQPGTLEATLLTGCKNISRARRTAEHELFAEDWQITLHSAVPVPENLRYVGIRAHFFSLREEAAENTPRMEAVQIIEDAFSYLVMAKKADSDAAPVRWEIEKIAWQGLGQKEFYLHFPADRLILLER